MEIVDNSNVPLLVGKHKDVVLSVDTIVSDSASVVRIKTLLVL